MAQHIEIRNEKAPKILKKIAESIEKATTRGMSPYTTSMKWQCKWRITGDEADKNIFITERYIGPGIVYGDTRGYFEVHMNGKVAEHIYLVA